MFHRFRQAKSAYNLASLVKQTVKQLKKCRGSFINDVTVKTLNDLVLVELKTLDSFINGVLRMMRLQ